MKFFLGIKTKKWSFFVICESNGIAKSFSKKMTKVNPEDLHIVTIVSSKKC